MPPLIPMDATSVHLDGNNMSELVNPGFIGRRRITEVFLNNSQIRVVTNFSLEGLTEVSSSSAAFTPRYAELPPYCRGCVPRKYFLLNKQ